MTSLIFHPFHTPHNFHTFQQTVREICSTGVLPDVGVPITTVQHSSCCVKNDQKECAEALFGVKAHNEKQSEHNKQSQIFSWVMLIIVLVLIFLMLFFLFVDVDQQKKGLRPNVYIQPAPSYLGTL